jgi:hypothetical protein
VIEDHYVKTVRGGGAGFRFWNLITGNLIILTRRGRVRMILLEKEGKGYSNIERRLSTGR